MAKKNNEYGIYPVIPLRNTLVVPNTITPLLVGRGASIKAADSALIEDKKIICITQKSNSDFEADPKAKFLYRTGTLCTILQVLKLPDGTMRLLVEGEQRILIERFYRNKEYLSAYFQRNDKVLTKNKVEVEALLRSFKKIFIQYINLNKSLPEEAMVPFGDTSKPVEFFYFAHNRVKGEVKRSRVESGHFRLELPYNSDSLLWRHCCCTACCRGYYQVCFRLNATQDLSVYLHVCRGFAIFRVPGVNVNCCSPCLLAPYCFINKLFGC